MSEPGPFKEDAPEIVTVRALESGADLKDAFAVRRQVFHIGQGIDETEDFDDKDKDADQFVAYIGEKPVGTARVRFLEDGTGKIERVAVLEEYRGKNYGLQIMQHILDHLKSGGTVKAVLESQSYAAPFYEKLGFHKVGDEFEEVGISHIKMEIELNPKNK